MCYKATLELVAAKLSDFEVNVEPGEFTIYIYISMGQSLSMLESQVEDRVSQKADALFFIFCLPIFYVFSFFIYFSQVFFFFFFFYHLYVN